MENFDSFADGEEHVHPSASAQHFDGDGYMGFDSFGMPEGDFGGENPYLSGHSRDLGEVEDGGEDEFSTAKMSGNEDFQAPPAYGSTFDDDLGDGQHSPAMSSPFGRSFESRIHSEFASGNGFPPSPDSNGKGFVHSDGPFDHSVADPIYGYPPASESLNGGSILPPLEEMQPEEGFLLREWKRQNAIRLEEKARLERERLSHIIDMADSYKDEFYEKRKMHCETNKNNNRDKEKVFLENLVTFHATADKHYWKAVGELIPRELPALESKSRGNKEKKPSVVINQGPKAGKATDLSRMRQVLVKLKHNPPAHMKSPPPPPQAAPAEGASGSDVEAVTVTGVADIQGNIPVVAAA
ncbi:hypothetical protein KP509_38G019700 [Ceratopteris richardii]|uniref:Clathrin light chain n=1 Tax=Ceratopteris richardii TaxID=49495 RepID=A0A8T2Q2Q7_CERRI|nr:hypothetical protein KP509_38G019700 [Ceratopteris richardii]